MAKPRKPETAAEPRKRRANASAPVVADVGPAARAGAIVSRRAADRLRSGHLWVYASDVLSIVAPEPEKNLIPVADQRGIFLGTALYSPQSQIALRMVSREALDEAAWLKLLALALARGHRAPQAAARRGE